MGEDTITRLDSLLGDLHQIEMEIQTEIYEREEAVRILLCALLAKEHVVLIGKPGTAKSELVARIANAFSDGSGKGLSRFQKQLNSFTKPEELFGGPDIPQLMAGNYALVTTNKAPHAQLVLLDEVFKADVLLNTLLLLMNERLFENGNQIIQADLMSLIGSSNEIPQGNDLQALWDRFLLRHEVGYIVDDANFESLLQARVNRTVLLTPPQTTMAQADLIFLQEQIPSIPVPDDVLKSLVKLRRELKDEDGIIASDRRWMKSVRVLQAHALVEGRTQVEEDDFMILTHILWSGRLEEKKNIASRVAKLANPVNAEALEIKDEVVRVWREAQGQLKAHQGDDESDFRAQLAWKTLSEVRGAQKKLKALESKQTRPSAQLAKAIATAKQIEDEIKNTNDL
jgi:MoxR-like ATPase